MMKEHYLTAHLGIVQALLNRGMTNSQIARELYQRGVRCDRVDWLFKGSDRAEDEIERAHVNQFRAHIAYLLRAADKPLNLARLTRRVAWAKEQLRLAEEALAEANNRRGLQ